MTGQKTNFNNISDELQDRLQDQLKKIDVGQLSPVQKKEKDVNIEWAGVKENGAELQQYINETLPEKSGRRPVKQLVKEIYTNKGATQESDDDTDVDDKKEDHTSVPDNGDASSDQHRANGNTADKIKPPVPPRAKKAQKPEVASKPKRETRQESDPSSSEKSFPDTKCSLNSQKPHHDSLQTASLEHTKDTTTESSHVVTLSRTSPVVGDQSIVDPCAGGNVPRMEHGNVIESTNLSEEQPAISGVTTRVRRRQRLSPEEREFIVATNDSLSEKRNARREAKSRKAREDMMVDRNILSIRIPNFESKHGDNKAAVRWNKIREYIRSGKLSLDNKRSREGVEDNNAPMHETSTTHERTRTPKRYLEPVVEALEDGVSAKSGVIGKISARSPRKITPESIQLGASVTDSRECKGGYMAIRSGIPVYDIKVSIVGNETELNAVNHKSSKGWDKVREYMRSGKLFNANKLSKESGRNIIQAGSTRSPERSRLRPKKQVGSEVVHRQSSTKPSDKWKRVRELMKAGKLVLDKGTTPKTTESRQKSRSIERRRVARNQLKRHDCSCRRETPVENTQKNSQRVPTIPTSPKLAPCSGKWQILRNHLKSGKFTLQREISATSKQPDRVSRTRSSDRVRKANVQVHADKVMPASGNSSTASNQVKIDTPERWNKQINECQISLKLKEPAPSRIPSIHVRNPVPSKSFEVWKASSAIKTDPLSILNSPEHKPLPNASERRLKLRERSERSISRNVFIENDRQAMQELTPWGARRLRSTEPDPDDASGRLDRQLESMGSVLKASATPYGTLCRINGFVIMLVNLVEKSANGDADIDLWNGACNELSTIEDDVKDCLATTVYSNAKVEMEFAENIFRDKLKRLISSEAHTSFSLNDDIEHLKTSAVAHYAAGFEEPVMIELRELLSHLHSLSCILPETCIRFRSDRKALDYKQLVQPNKAKKNALISVLTKPFKVMSGRLFTKKGLPVPDTSKVTVETIEDTPQPTDQPIVQTHNLATLPKQVFVKKSAQLIESTRVSRDEPEPAKPTSLRKEEPAKPTPTRAEPDPVSSAEEVALYEKKLLANDELTEAESRTCRSVVRAIVGAASVGVVGALVVATDLSTELLALWL